MHPCKMQQRRHTIRSGKSAADPGKTSPVIKKTSRQRISTGSFIEKNSVRSDGQNFFFLSSKKIVNLFEILVMKLLHIIFSILLDILAHALLHGLFQTFYSIAAGVAHAHFGILSLAFRLLHQRTAAFFSQRGGWKDG